MDTITGLVVKRNTDIVTMVEAWASCERLLHGWIGTGGACKICISTNWCSIARTSGEIMVKVSVTWASSSRVERRWTGRSATKRWNNVILSAGRLPISNGVEATIEFLGARKFPFAEDCPKDCNTSHRSCNCDENSQSSRLGLCGRWLCLRGSCTWCDGR